MSYPAKDLKGSISGMTRFASEFLYFEPGIKYISFLLWLVTFIAWDINMLAIKFKSGCVVIEPGSFPIVSTVAIGTAGNTIFFKLPVMFISMTCRTLLRQPTEFLLYDSVTFTEMTTSAFCLYMHPGKLEACF